MPGRNSASSKQALLAEVQRALAAAADARTAAGQDAYFRGVIKHRGIKTPAVDAVCKAFLQQQAGEAGAAELRALAAALLAEPLQEDKLAGICVWQHALLCRGGAEQWRGELAALQRVYTDGHVFAWSTCDWICGRLLAPLIKQLLRNSEAGQGEACARAVMAWHAHSNLWLRRSSVVAFVTLARLPDEQVFPGFGTALLGTLASVVQGQERFAQTGTGWVLREVGKRDDRQLLQFVEAHLRHFSSEGLRALRGAMGLWGLATVLATALVATAAGDAGARLLLQAPQSCNNTESGRWHVTDDRGIVCARSTLDYTTGCCREGQQHSCDSCHEEDRCCSQYENCVSCCLKPEHSPEQHMHGIYRGRNKPETGHWESPFEYCRAVCRTTARSTQHENAFILDRKYCFSKLGRPRVPVPPAPPLPKSVLLVAGAAGQSCDAACAAKSAACQPAHFASLNDCNSLRAKFMCEAGCGAGAPDQREFPGYIEGNAPKHQKPAFCSTLPALPGHDAPRFNCTRGLGSVRRLCPCEPLPPAAVQAAADGAAAAAQQPAGGVAGSAGAEAAAAQLQQQAAAAAAAQQAAAAAQQLPGAQTQATAAQQQAAAVQQQQAAAAAAAAAALPVGDAAQQAVQPGGGAVAQQR